MIPCPIRISIGLKSSSHCKTNHTILCCLAINKRADLVRHDATRLDQSHPAMRGVFAA